MEQPNQGTQPQPGQPQSGTQAEAGQAPGYTPNEQRAIAAQNPAAQPEPPPQPTVEQLQAQIAERDRQLEQATNSARHFQSQADKFYTALTGNGQPSANQPPPDPVAPYVQELISQGYDEKSARAVAGTAYKMMQPLQQQLSQARQASQLDYIVSSTAQQNPHLFRTQQDYDAARQQAEQLLNYNGQVDPNFVRNSAIINWFNANEKTLFSNGQQPSPQQQYQPNPQPAPQRPNPFAGGMWNPGVGLQPTQPTNTQRQMSAEEKAAADFIQSFTKPKS